jgi:hypothetical protein
METKPYIHNWIGETSYEKTLIDACTAIWIQPMHVPVSLDMSSQYKQINR